MKLKACSIILHLRLPAPTSFSLSCCYFRPVSALSLTTAGSTDLHPAPPQGCVTLVWIFHSVTEENTKRSLKRLQHAQTTDLPEGFFSTGEITGCQREPALKLPLAAPTVPGLDWIVLDYFHGKLFLSQLKSSFVRKEWGCILGMIWYFKRCFL